jgi:hypothetical protein
MLLGEVITYDRYQVHVGKKTGGCGKIGGGAPQDIILFAKRRLHRIKSHRANNQYTHLSLLSKSGIGKGKGKDLSISLYLYLYLYLPISGICR